MKGVAHKRFTANNVLAKLIERCFARSPSRVLTVKRVPKAVPASALGSARHVASTPAAVRVSASQSAAPRKKETVSTKIATPARKTKMKIDRVPLFADLLEGTNVSRVEGWEHRTRGGGYVAAPRRRVDQDSLPMRVEGWGHRARDGRRLL